MIKDKNNPILMKIIGIMNAWSEIVKKGKVDIDDINILKNAIYESNEYIWFEAGQKLIELMRYDNKIRNIFIETLSDKNWRPRFNTVALSENFDKELAGLILKQGIDDKNSKVREKTADVILSREDKYLLPLLEARLQKEDNIIVKRAINFTLENIHNLNRDENGSIVFTIKQ